VLQEVPQLPQLFGSVCSLTQMPPQGLSPAAQRKHCPLEQVPVDWHVVPFGAAGFEQAPVAWSMQVHGTWHWYCAVQVTPMQWSVPAQTPAVQ